MCGICLALSFLQVVYSAISSHAWTLLVSGVRSSAEAYQICSSLIVFGHENKNIWASKVLIAGWLTWMGLSFSDHSRWKGVGGYLDSAEKRRFVNDFSAPSIFDN
jgi:hypothetical protein